MLNADFSIYTHDESGTQIIRALQHSIPVKLAGHLKVSHPVTTFVVTMARSTSFSVEPVSVLPKQRWKSACAD